MPELPPPVAYLLDLDGTLYAGGAAVPGAPQTLDRLRREGTPFRLVTNTTSRSRAMLVERLRGYGFGVRAEEIFSATLAGGGVADNPSAALPIAVSAISSIGGCPPEARASRK